MITDNDIKITITIKTAVPGVSGAAGNYLSIFISKSRIAFLNMSFS